MRDRLRYWWDEFTAMLHGFALIAWWLFGGAALLVISALFWDWLTGL